jgi:hypothetical protein
LLAVGLVASGLLLPSSAHAGFGDRSLREGSRGSDVRVLQDYLTRVGLETTVDGMYGPRTARRVRSWERRSVRRTNGRVSRREARKLSSQVAQGTRVYERPAAAEPMSATGEKATIGPDGRAIAPESAPQEVKDVIAAANEIHGKPYKYGGGHGRWKDSGYDCSGAMSYALHGGGLVDRPMTSGDFMSYGDRGKGSWITVYAHGGHGFLVIAGLRFDTGWNNAGKGPRWSAEMRPTKGYTVRHPSGF